MVIANSFAFPTECTVGLLAVRTCPTPTHLLFRDVEELGHVCPLRGREVLSVLEHFLQLEYLPSGERRPHLRMNGKSGSLIPSSNGGSRTSPSSFCRGRPRRRRSRRCARRRWEWSSRGRVACAFDRFSGNASDLQKGI